MADSVFPAGFDDLLTNFTDWTGPTLSAPTTAVLTAGQVNLAFSAIEKIEAYLGLGANGAYATVAARLAALEVALYGVDGGPTALPSFAVFLDGGPSAVPTFTGTLDGGPA